jgi:hypothetical protein
MNASMHRREHILKIVPVVVTAITIVLQVSWAIRENRRFNAFSDSGGSQAIVRLLDGLDPAYAEFSLLPPHFMSKSNCVFPLEDIFADYEMYLIALTLIIRNLTAQIVYQSGHIREFHNPMSPIFKSRLFICEPTRTCMA